MAAFNIVTWSTAKNGNVRQASNAAAFDFQSIRVGASNLEISENSGHFNFNSKKLTGVADGSSAADAVSLGQMNAAISLAVLTGGSLKEAVLISEQLSASLGIRAASVFFATAAAVDNDTVILKNNSTTETYTYAAAAAAFTPATGATAADTMQNLASRINLDSADWSAKWLPDNLDSINAGGVVVIYEKAVAAGASTSRTYGVWATQANAKSVDYSALSEYKTGQASVTLPSVDGAASFGFRRILANMVNGEIHYVHETDIMQSWDDDANAWTTFQNGSVPDATSASGGGVKGKVTVDSDFGLNLTAGVLSIKKGDGLDFFSGDLGVKLDGATLAKSATGVKVAAAGITATELATSVAGAGLSGGAGSALAVGAGNGISVVGSAVSAQADSSGGLEVVVAGIGVKLDGSTIAKSASGVKVADAGITATQLAASVAGAGLSGGAGTALAVSVADGLELNGDNVEAKLNGASLTKGVSGLAVNAQDGLLSNGSGLSVNYTEQLTNGEGSAVTVGKVVYQTASGSVLLAVNNVSNFSKFKVGIAKDATIASAGVGSILMRAGAKLGGFTGLTSGPVYVSGTAGDLTQDTSGFTTGMHVYRVGYAISATEIIYDPEHLIEL